MKTRLILLTATALLVSSCDAANETTTGPLDEASTSVTAADDETAIRGQVAKWLELIKSRDAAAIAQMYTEDGAVMPPNAPMSKGRTAVAETWEALMSAPGFELTFAPEVIVLSSSGDMALDRGTYRMRVAPDGNEQIDIGKYVVVWQKVDGEWKAAADIINSDLPPGGA